MGCKACFIELDFELVNLGIAPTIEPRISTLLRICEPRCTSILPHT